MFGVCYDTISDPIFDTSKKPCLWVTDHAGRLSGGTTTSGDRASLEGRAASGSSSPMSKSASPWAFLGQRGKRLEDGQGARLPEQ